ncbi:Ca(2+)-dependent cysteine protease [Coemansia biformis]|uniref:Ca(2+)-dependent cysteine protease n=1 Tax=Coemansia biformis TaxID=1286918 RepID=A0A9W7YJ56_9FUNG|nr:Ca(2+)-dependent cysteine protease [Coemansia biformis]
MSPVQQQQQQQQYPPVRHSSLREQPVRHSPVQQQQAQMLQRHYSMNHPPDHRDPALPQRLAPTQQLHPGDKSGGYSGPAHSRSSYVPVATTDSFCAPQHAHGLYDQQRAMALQPAMASLANSMGALSLSHQQQQQQQQSQWAPLTVSAVLSQPTLVGSSATMPAPYRGVVPAAAVASSTTLVRPQTSLQQPVADGGGVPMWGRINANAFKAYQHQVTVQKSSLSGTKYALVIGINYYEMEYSQTSNINSAHTMRELLVRKYGYKDKNVVLLSDDQESERWHPTHHNITTAIRRMMREVRPNDAVLVYYCGFGRLPVQVLEKRTEVLSAIRRLRSDYILPSDFETTGAIDTAHLHKTLVHSLPPSARLTVLFNCVVSETGLGVAYKYTSTSGTPVLTNAIAGSNLFEAGMKAGHACTASFGDLSQRLEASLMQQQQQQQHTDASAETLNRIRQSSGDIIVFGWDRDYANPKHKQYLSHTPSNQFGHYWAAAMEGAMRTRGATTFADVLGYMQASTGELAMLPFIACGRKISMDEEFVI